MLHAQALEPQKFNLVSTVGLDPATCAESTHMALPGGTQRVIVCLRAETSEGMELHLHDLLSEQLGVLVSDLHYTLGANASVFYTYALDLSGTTAIASAWIARNLDGQIVCDLSQSLVTVGDTRTSRPPPTTLECP